MKTLLPTPVENATDPQLRFLARDFQWLTDYKHLLQSQLPLLTVERAQIIGLLHINNIKEFLQ